MKSSLQLFLRRTVLLVPVPDPRHVPLNTFPKRFKFLHFKVLWVQGVRIGSRLTFRISERPAAPTALAFPPRDCSPLCPRSSGAFVWVRVWVCILSLRPHMALSVAIISLEIRWMNLPVLFFFLKIVLASLVPLPFHVNLR